MKEFLPSELIINESGSIYHLDIKPDEIAHKIIVVGDQDRVEVVSAFFDTIEHKSQKREFSCATGTYKGKTDCRKKHPHAEAVHNQRIRACRA